MVAVFDHKDVSGYIQSAQDGPQLVGRAEGIARTLDKQHRRANAGKVARPQPVGTARRVQRVAQEHQARDALLARRCDLGRYASPHRLAADYELPVTGVVVKSSAADRLDDGAIAAFQLVVG